MSTFTVEEITKLQAGGNEARRLWGRRSWNVCLPPPEAHCVARAHSYASNAGGAGPVPERLHTAVARRGVRGPRA